VRGGEREDSITASEWVLDLKLEDDLVVVRTLMPDSNLTPLKRLDLLLSI
jgi:hypothetical protein